MDFEVTTGSVVTEGKSLGSRWANFRLNLPTGSYILAAIWEGPNYDACLEALKSNCRELNRLLKESEELSEKSRMDFLGRK